MPDLTIDAIATLLMAGLFIAVTWRLYRRRRHIGPGAIGTVQEILSEDRRKAVEIIVEQRAEARRPENADGNLPELEAPKRRPS
jgi:hypothetical protein